MDQLDKLAKAIALSVNAIHSGKEDALDPLGRIACLSLLIKRLQNIIQLETLKY